MQLMSNLHNYISIQQAADQTGLSYYYIRALVLDNKVKHIKSGAKYLINTDSLAEYLESQEQEQ